MTTKHSIANPFDKFLHSRNCVDDLFELWDGSRKLTRQFNIEQIHALFENVFQFFMRQVTNVVEIKHIGVTILTAASVRGRSGTSWQRRQRHSTTSFETTFPLFQMAVLSINHLPTVSFFNCMSSFSRWWFASLASINSDFVSLSSLFRPYDYWRVILCYNSWCSEFIYPWYFYLSPF